MNRVGLSKCPTRKTKQGKKVQDPTHPLSKAMLKKLKAGEFLQWYCGDMTFLLIKDNVLMKLLLQSHSWIKQVRRELSIGEKKVPQALTDYATYARGVDVINQLHYNYIMGRKSTHCWPRLVWWLLELCILNAYWIWKWRKNNKKTHLDFRQLLMEEIIEKYHTIVQQASTGRNAHNTNNSDDHSLMHSDKQGRCSVCARTKNSPKWTKFKCLCNKYVCAVPCYDVHRSLV